MTAPRARSSRAAPVIQRVARPQSAETQSAEAPPASPQVRVGPAAPVIQRLLASLLRCPGCGAAAGGKGVCGGCAESLREALAAAAAPTGDVAWLGPYAGPWLRLVQALKYRGQRHLARYLGDLLADLLLRSPFRPDLVTHVPVSPAGLRARGFDQAELLARVVAGRLRAPHRALLKRRQVVQPDGGGGKRLVRQASLGLLARSGNAAGAYRSRALRGESVLLIDDVLTTGATAAACKSELLASGAAEVRLAVVARAVRGGE